MPAFLMTITCRWCGASVDGPDDGLGHRLLCSRCGMPSMLPETSVEYAVPSRHIVFYDFLQVLARAERDRLNDGVLLPAGFRLDAAGVLRNGFTGEPADAADAHRRVQAIPRAQYDAYQLAMDVWH